jgi:2-oxoglutarate ferredoxin oxidoreductase subunit beta
VSVVEKYLRVNKMPHIWCPGCGNGIVLGAFIRAIDKLGYSKEETVVVSGIGCSSRASGYLDFNTLHTTHGRALAFATGIKVTRPELKVFVIMGDGDATAIGGNHFIHAARRNIDITAIVFNNSIYGMTGGQYSPLTPPGSKATTAPYGTLEKPFNIPELAKAAGATYVARGTSYHAKMLSDLIYKGAQNKGFSMIEAITQCPISFGRRNKMGSGADMLKWQKDISITVKAAGKLPPEKLEGKLIIGEIYNSEAPEFTEQYAELVERISPKRGEG